MAVEVVKCALLDTLVVKSTQHIVGTQQFSGFLPLFL
jgi:hypothetical protein